MNIFLRLRERVRAYDDANNFTCDICAREVFANERVCKACRGILPWNDGNVCPLCGRKVLEEGLCIECKDRPLRTDKARSVFLHEGDAARLVLRFKRGEPYLNRTAAELALPLVRREFPDADGVVFVPMTKKAERRRGYNQSRLFAEALSRSLGIPVFDVAVKQRETEQQKTLGRRAREENLQRCFHVFDRKAVNGKTLLIVDDTLTTGATVSELADTLKRAGAARVYAVTVTGVQNKTPFGIPPEKKI